MTPAVLCSVLDNRSEHARRLMAHWPSPGVGGETRSGDLRKLRHLARTLMHEILMRQLGPGSWTITADPNGKPGVRELENDRGFGISLAHGGDMVAVAMSRLGPIGIDIEPHRSRDIEGIARYGFGPAEQQVVAQGGAPAFFRMWTLREAMGKATGQGLALVTDGCDRAPALPEEGTWTQDGWLLAHRYSPPGYSLAIAVQLQQRALPVAALPRAIIWEGVPNPAV